jgi:hypothetical protein
VSYLTFHSDTSAKLPTASFPILGSLSPSVMTNKLRHKNIARWQANSRLGRQKLGQVDPLVQRRVRALRHFARPERIRMLWLRRSAPVRPADRFHGVVVRIPRPNRPRTDESQPHRLSPATHNEVGPLPIRASKIERDALVSQYVRTLGPLEGTGSPPGLECGAMIIRLCRRTRPKSLTPRCKPL